MATVTFAGGLPAVWLFAKHFSEEPSSTVRAAASCALCIQQLIFASWIDRAHHDAAIGMLMINDGTSCQHY